MASRKLSDSDKQTILELYRQPGETTSTLAERYGVSNSTISRFLKTSFSEAEYEILIQQKRSARPADSGTVEIIDLEPPSKLEIVVAPAEPLPKTERRSRRRSTSTPPSEQRELPVQTSSETDATIAAIVDEITPTPPDYVPESEVLEEMLGEDLLDQDDLQDDLDDELDDLDDDDFDGEPLPEGGLLVAAGHGKLLLQVLPLAEASLPRTCYLVVDRSAELIARPLRDFGDLGQIPDAEIQEKTLPVFDNHRVAKRYSNPRTQRVIKLPDSRVLQKTSSHLQAKGITRLLVDGQVYSLTS